MKISPCASRFAANSSDIFRLHTKKNSYIYVQKIYTYILKKDHPLRRSYFGHFSTGYSHTRTRTYTRTRIHTCTNMRTHTRIFIRTLKHMCVFRAGCECVSFIIWQVSGLDGTEWRRCIGCLIFIDHLPQKSPMISASFAQRDLQLKASYAFSPTCNDESRLFKSAGLFCGRDI